MGDEVSGKLSVVIPAYNEEELIALTASALTEILDREHIPFELLFVDDGSRDGTWSKIQTAAEQDKRVRGVSFSRNFGKESAIFAGLANAPAIPVETRFVYDGVRFDRYQRNRRSDWNLGTEFASVVETRLSFKNDTAAPLPPGEFRLLRGHADQALEWLGTDWLPALKPGESATINLGPAAGLSGRRLRTSYADVIPLKVADESFEITLENQTPADQTVTVIEHFYRGENHEITAASAEYVPGTDPHSIQFTTPVKAGATQTFTYTVRYTW